MCIDIDNIRFYLYYIIYYKLKKEEKIRKISKTIKRQKKNIDIHRNTVIIYIYCNV